MFYEAVLSRDVVNKSASAYEVDGMVEPRLFNEGDSTVYINEMEVKPGDWFDAGFKNCVLKGSIKIDFRPEPGENNLVVITYGRISGPYLNPATGTPLSTSAKAQLQIQGKSC